MDLSALSPPVVFELNDLGEVRVEARLGAFETWLVTGMEEKRWADGLALMRAILAEQAVGPDGARLDEGTIAALPRAVIERGAHAFLDAEDPRMGAIGGGSPLAEGESQAERLKRVLFAEGEEALSALKRFNEVIERPMREYQRSLGAVGTAMAEHMRLVSQNRDLEALRQIVEGNQFKNLLRPTIDTSVFDAARGISLSFRDDLAPFTGAVEKMRDEVSRIAAGLDRSALALDFRPLELELHGITNSMALARQIGREFDFRTPAIALAALGATRSVELGIAERLAQLLPRPGFQTTLAAALEGVVAQGAASDVLGRYDLPADPDAPIFSAVIEGVGSLDVGDVQERNERLEEIHRVLVELLATVKEGQKPRITIEGTIALIGLFVSIAGLAVAAAQWAGDELERKGPGTVELLAKLDELKSVRPTIGAQRDIRYVHERAWLRAEPAADGLELRAVFPDQRVRVIDTSGNWAKVEVYDYASDRPIVGWISRRRLRHTPLD